jgi:pyruvate dehydrogenase E1 component alpha subunit
MPPVIYRVLDEDGAVVENEVPKLSDNDLIKIYKAMVTTRLFDDHIVRLQRQGRIPLHAPNKGEEAVGAGAVAALESEDWLFTYYRSFSAWFMRGVGVGEILDEFLGNSESLSRGTDFGTSFGRKRYKIFPHISAIAMHLPVGVGFAIAASSAGEKLVVAETFGDGATSRGDFHEAMNFAGIFKAPVVFICQNDQWAISVPYAKQTAAESIALKARGYGFEGMRVDGNDVLAVYAAVKGAADRARKGDGPTLIEALTYRLGPHTTADDPSRYRDAAEVEAWVAKDPIKRFRRFLVSRSIITDEGARAVESEVAEEIKAKSKERMQIGSTPPEEIFRNVYSRVPWHLEEQLDRVRRKEETTKR